ncbi:MAG: helix-turn-helix transcriptional regulator [Salinarimonas sp.]|nr:helix-turn-helix transcriptional regulator [Salinarimonas sp.]
MTTRAPTDIDRFVGQRVRLARKMARLSQQKLGEVAGVTYQQVQKYENGTDRIGAGRLYQVALATDQPIEFFFNFDDDVEPRETGRVDVLADAGIQRLVAAAANIKSKALLANLAQIADTFASTDSAA